MLNADLTRNAKQVAFLMAVLQAVQGKSSKRNFFIGGAVRGGKTFICLIVLVILCRMFPGSKWHIIRESFPTLRRTTIPSMEKILRFSRSIKWSRNPSDYFVELKNGSRIHFISENYANDKDLDAFKGLETNGFLCEQIEELQEETWMKCLERTGSWYVDPMPPAINMATFNPSFNWVKDKIYEPAMAGTLHPSFYYITALPNDNPYVTADQWAAWDMLDDDSKARFIMGSWDIDVKGQFFSAFDRKKHLKPTIELKKDEYLRFSFDFNVDPMTCTLYQTDLHTYFHAVREYRIPDSDTYELCERIKEDYGEYLSVCKIRGDASGSNRMAGTKGKLSHYRIIANQLGLKVNQFNVPKSNPLISESRAFCNSILKSFPNFYISEEGCPHLIKDLMFLLVGTDEKGLMCIQKKGKNPYINIDNAQLGHLGDNLRYGIHTDLKDFIKVPKS